MSGPVARIGASDRFGLLSPAVDAHDLGLSAFAALLRDCGIRVFAAPSEAREAAAHPERPDSVRALSGWVRAEGLTVLGFSYRLDPADGARLFDGLVAALGASGLLAEKGGRLRALYFAGLPEACALVGERHPRISGLFAGEETPLETLAVLGLPASALPASALAGCAYDEALASFGRGLVARADYLGIGPVDRSGAPNFGRRGDGVAGRVAHGRARGLPPLIRAHAGPYLPDRRAAVELFLSWTADLARGGLLDVLSIGSSQLSQSAFGEDHEGLLDGGGVPLDSPGEFAEVWRAARPMLVRTYAGTKDVPALARMYEETIDIAWHALSLWWFCETDGRGPNGLLPNLREHLEAMRYAAASGKPLEPNVPHHFSFRGADDVTAIAAGYVAARAAKAAGVGKLVLQVMLNTPKGISGVQDLAKARALLVLVRELEEPSFEVYLQPRGGLDHFSADEAKAKAQLAAVAALADDIEAGDDSSPDIVHVVGYSEARGLADPPVIEESIRITRHALAEYRRLRRAGSVPDMSRDPEAERRTAFLLSEARALVAGIEASIPRPYGAEGLYEIMASGFFAVPGLAGCREELKAAAAWTTSLSGGAVVVVDEGGRPVPAAARAAAAAEEARRRAGRPGPSPLPAGR